MMNETSMTEGLPYFMNAATRARRGLCRAALVTAVISGVGAAYAAPATPAPRTAAPVDHSAGSITAVPVTAMLPANPAALPSSVLLFPAIVSTDTGADAAAPVAGAKSAGVAVAANLQTAQAIVTGALRTFLTRGKIGVVVYNRQLPSIQRAVNEGVKPEDAASGPGDDPRKAQRFADIVGATEYLTATIDNYAYNPATKTATFNLSLSRYASDGSPLGATEQKAVGSAPDSITGSHREAYAVAAAADVVAEQTVEGVYPQTVAVINPPKPMVKKRRTAKKLGGRFLVPVIAVGAALIAPHT